MHGITIRPAAANDAEAIARIQVASWRWAYEGILPSALLASQSVERRRAQVEAALSSRPGARILLAHGAAGEPVGFASSGPHRDATLGLGELYALYVLEAFCGRGVGAALLAQSEAAMAADGFVRAALWVLDRNVRARRFYERCGWRRDGRTQSEDLEGVLVTELRYVRELDPVPPPGRANPSD